MELGIIFDPFSRPGPEHRHVLGGTLRTSLLRREPPQFSIILE
jgi:hypothetical protein